MLREEYEMAEERAKDAEKQTWEETVRYHRDLEKQLDEQVSMHCRRLNYDNFFIPRRFRIEQAHFQSRYTEP